MKFILKKDKLKIDNAKTPNSGSINYYLADVEYDISWDNLSIEAIIIKKDEEKGTAIAVINNQLYIDKELKGRYFIGFIGYKIENNIKTYQISTDLKPIQFNQGAGEIKVTNKEEIPTPSEWEIYLAQIQEFIDNGNVIINQANNLDVDLEGNILTITKKDGTTESVNTKGEKGNDGQDGEDGYTPQKGIDYYTNADKIEMTTNVVAEITPILNQKANISDIPDVSNFITKTVNDLTNYYLKSEIYTQTEVNNLIGSIQQFHYEIVQTLPITGANNILYLVPKTTSETENVYDEYVYANNNWEKIGDTQIDLTGYATETWVNTQIADFLTTSQITTLLNTALADYTTTANLTTLLAGKQDNITSTNKLSSDLIEDTNNTNKFVTTTEKTTWNNKQEQLVSGTTIKTVNNQNLLGSGNINIQNGEALPIGSEIDYDGNTVPTGWQQIEDKGEIYSTTEQRIGTWIDGKPLYRKTITLNFSDVTMSSDRRWAKNVSYFTNVDTLLVEDVTDLTNGRPAVTLYALDADKWNQTMIVTKSAITLTLGTERSTSIANHDFAITVKYTKTTD